MESWIENQTTTICCKQIQKKKKSNTQIQGPSTMKSEFPQWEGKDLT